MPPTLVAFLQSSARATSQAAHHVHYAHGGHIPPWLIHLGLPGLFFISFLNAAIISLLLPGSADLLLLFLAAQRGAQPIVLTLIAIVASVIGGYTTWKAGQAGGESMLRHFAPKRMVEPMTRWMHNHGFLTIATSAMLPPPLPLVPMLLGAGALGASRNQFLLAFSLARTLRYGLIVWVGVRYGRHVLRLWNRYLAEWSGVILWSSIVLMVAATLFGYWQYRKRKRNWEAECAGQSATATA